MVCLIIAAVGLLVSIYSESIMAYRYWNLDELNVESYFSCFMK